MAIHERFERQGENHEVRITKLEATLEEVRDDVKELLALANGSKGFFLGILRLGGWLASVAAIGMVLWTIV